MLSSILTYNEILMPKTLRIHKLLSTGREISHRAGVTLCGRSCKTDERGNTLRGTVWGSTREASRPFDVFLPLPASASPSQVTWNQSTRWDGGRVWKGNVYCKKMCYFLWVFHSLTVHLVVSSFPNCVLTGYCDVQYVFAWKIGYWYCS